VLDLGSFGAVIGRRPRIPTVGLALFARATRERLVSTPLGLLPVDTVVDIWHSILWLAFPWSAAVSAAPLRTKTLPIFHLSVADLPTLVTNFAFPCADHLRMAVAGS